MAAFEPWSRERGAEIIARESVREGATLPILHALQGAFGYIHADAIPMIAETLNLTRAEVHGVVSFYHDFRREPARPAHAAVCAAPRRVSRSAPMRWRSTCGGVWAWTGTTPPPMARVTLEPVFCLGLCAVGPSAMLDGAPLGRLDNARLDSALERAR